MSPNKEVREKMGREERCPKCGSKKIDCYLVPRKCRICGFTWAGKDRTKTPKKDEVDFESVEVTLFGVSDKRLYTNGFRRHH